MGLIGQRNFLGLECLTAIIDAVASLAIQKVKVLPSPVLQYEPIRRGTHMTHATRIGTTLTVGFVYGAQCFNSTIRSRRAA